MAARMRGDESASKNLKKGAPHLESAACESDSEVMCQTRKFRT